jgi:hypothetical protein|tara:strand:+ start:463 stop:1011 length:549 start_codon:yes stop_codon:yes gene_type:complete
MAKEQILCFWKRPAGNRKDLSILEVSSPHEMAGETVICNCQGQEWIASLETGDPVLVWGPLKKGREGDYLGNPCPNGLQPLSDGFEPSRLLKEEKPLLQTEISIETSEPDLQPQCSTQAQSTSSIRIDTFLNDSDQIEVFGKVANFTTNKEAGRLLIAQGIKSLPPGAKALPGDKLLALLDG